MAITDALDVTPNRTFSTVQFENETLNVVVNALLTVFILINIGSITSKLVQITSGDHFSFKSFRRYIIFTSSDDPVRLISWFRHRYQYHQKGWRRHPQKINWKRLLLPLSARLFIFFASIASIVITIPGEKVLSGCERGDFVPILDTSQGNFDGGGRILCSDVPIISDVGNATSTLSFCSTPLVADDPLPGSAIALVYSPFGLTGWILGTENGASGGFFFFEWKKSSGNQFISLPLNSIPAGRLAAVIVEALNRQGFDCVLGEGSQISNDEGFDNFFFFLEGCTFQPSDVQTRVDRYLSSSFVLQKRDGPAARYDVANDQQTTDCPIQVVVNRPIVNLLPLAILLVILFVINIAVTLMISNHGNILDSTYHLVKETLGHDCMSNPLEESVEQMPAGDDVPLRRVLRRGTGHVGFLKQAGDEDVEDFGPEITVCGSVAPGEAVAYDIGRTAGDGRGGVGKSSV